MARLIIRNIGPIKDIVLDLKKVNVFMGPQGCGKSTLAKIISFCSWLEKDSDATGKAEAKGLVPLLTNYHRMEGYFRRDSEVHFCQNRNCCWISRTNMGWISSRTIT